MKLMWETPEVNCLAKSVAISRSRAGESFGGKGDGLIGRGFCTHLCVEFFYMWVRRGEERRLSLSIISCLAVKVWLSIMLGL